jgi:hypothetical protein
METMNDLDYAKRILVHYFKLALPRWDPDNQAEIEAAVDSLIAAAAAEAVRKLRDREKMQEAEP